MFFIGQRLIGLCRKTQGSEQIDSYKIIANNKIRSNEDNNSAHQNVSTEVYKNSEKNKNSVAGMDMMQKFIFNHFAYTTFLN